MLYRFLIRRIYPIGLLSLLFSPSSQAVILDSNHHLQLHGYLQRIGISDVKDADLRFKNRLLGDYTETALNLHWQPDNKTQLVGSVHYQSLSQEENNTTVNILALSRQLYSASWGNINLTGGRLKNTLLGLNSAQDSPLSRETTDYARVYLGNMAQAFDSIDGGRLSSQWRTDAGDSFQAHFYIGKMETNNFGAPKLTPNISLKIKDYRLNGLKVQWEPYHISGLLLASSYVQVNTHSDVHIQPLNRHIPIDTNINVAILMARYEWDNWRLSSEIAQAQLDFSLFNQHLKETLPAGYLSLVWQPPSPWTATLRYEVTEYSNISQKLAMSANLQSANSAFSSNTYQGIIGYVRYKLTPHFYLGLEVDQLYKHPHDQQETVVLAQIGAHF